MARTSSEHSAPHRPLRADHARGGAPQRGRRPAVRLRGVRPPAAGRPALRRRRRNRPVPRGAAGVPVRGRGDRATCADAGSSTRRPATGWPATASPATSAGMPRGRSTSPAHRSSSSSRRSPRACVLETLVLSILNHDTAIASAASRMTAAAGDRPCIEMGSRRTHEEAAVAAARAAYIAGFATTSNLEAGRRYGVPTAGTAAHAFTLVHDTEREAFEAQVASLGPGTTLLVDTYDVAEAVRTAVEVAGTVARRGPARLGRPAGAGPAGPRPARLARRHRHANRRHVRPRRVCDRRARVGAGRRLRGRDPAGDRFGRTHGEHGLQARLALRRRRRRCGRSRSAARRRRRSVAASGRCAGCPGRGGGGGGRRHRGTPDRRRGRPAVDGRPGPRRRAAGPAGPDRRPGTTPGLARRAAGQRACGCSAARSPSRRCSRTGTAAET